MKINFLKNRYIFLAIAAFLVVFSLVLVFAKGFDKGIDFSGGYSFNIKINNLNNKDNLIYSISTNFKHSSIQEFNDSEVVVTIPIKEDSLENINKTVQKIATKHDSQITKSDSIGSQMSSIFIQDSIMACLFSFTVIMIYMAFRFNIKFALAGILALAHDVIITLGFILVFKIEINLTIITAILTIIGYCINDKVVVFDKIRTFLSSKREGIIDKVINESISSVVIRSILTSVTTCIAAGSLLFFNDFSIRNFGLCVIFGVTIGTYSSLFIATSLLKVFKIDFLKPKKEKDLMFFAS